MRPTTPDSLDEDAAHDAQPDGLTPSRCHSNSNDDDQVAGKRPSHHRRPKPPDSNSSSRAGGGEEDERFVRQLEQCLEEERFAEFDQFC